MYGVHICLSEEMERGKDKYHIYNIQNKEGRKRKEKKLRNSFVFLCFFLINGTFYSFLC